MGKNFTADMNCNESVDKVEMKKFFDKEDGLFDKRIWRVEDVARFLGCSVKHIYNLSYSKTIPKKKKGKFLFFVPDEILEWVLQGDCL